MDFLYLYVVIMSQNQSTKIISKDKFGYSLETFRSSALASLETRPSHKENSKNIRQTNERLFGSFNAFADSNFKFSIGKLTSDFCFNKKPNCCKCPVSEICDSSESMTSLHSRNRKNIEGLTFVDMFCGAGGMSAGLVEAGYKPVFAIDNDPASIKTYIYNHRFFEGLSVAQNDVSEIERANFSAITKLHPDLIVGGPPCQGFSNANRQRLSDDPRNLLYRAFLGSLKASGAKYAILENVTGMARAAPSIIKEFEEIGYVVEFFILNAQEFGVPQNRNRLFIIAKRTSDLFKDRLFFDSFKEAIDQKKCDKSYGIRNFIEDLPPVIAKTISNSTEIESLEFGFSCWITNEVTNNKQSIIFNHRSKYLNARDLQIYSLLKPGDDTTARAIKEINPYRNRDHIFKDKFFRLHPDKPSKTVTAHMYYDTHMYIHPFQARGLTPRETARIQGFKDNFLFFGYPNEWYRQIGNAVSPTISNVLGEALKYAIGRYNEHN